MRNRYCPGVFCTLVLSVSLSIGALSPAAAQSIDDRTRLIILADMGNEPDEVQQMVHMIACSNEFLPEGLIAVTGKYLHPDRRQEYRRVTHPELFHEIIDAYEQVLPNLRQHATGWHSPDTLRSLVCSGQPGYGIDDVGEGKSSPGSRLLIDAMKKDDPRPIWIVVNAGSNTLAQALLEFRRDHSSMELAAAVAKLRIFENGAQDNAGAWICQQFPAIHWIRSNYQTYAYGGPGGTDGDTRVNLGPHFWGDYDYTVEGQNDWLIEHVMSNHGPLGAVFPERRFGNGKLAFKEGGGTIPWMGLVNRGLFSIDHPHWGGWGGRFTQDKVADFWSRHQDISVDEKRNAPFYTYREASDVWTDERDGQTYHGDYVPVWRWREAMYNDFRCRMDWMIKPYAETNHHPVAAFHEDKSDLILELAVTPGATLELDASKSHDPDGDDLTTRWWIYEEAGNYAGNAFIASPDALQTTLTIPTGAAGKQIHVILEVKDQNPIAALFDYRRIVLNVSKTYDHAGISRQKH